MIQSEQPITITKTYSYKIAHILIQNVDNQWKADIQTTVTDEEGAFVKSIVNTYVGEEYNKWWDKFNSGRAVVEKVVEDNQIQAIIPDTIEESFLNDVNSSENTEINS